MARRIAITGADGMVGRELGRESIERGLAWTGWKRADCDVTDEDSVRRALDDAEPDVVIHAAAWTDVDGCEADPVRAFRVNGRGTRNVAAACEAAGVRLVMISTDYVFPGDQDRPYREYDAPGPISVYGWSKLMGEEAVLSMGARGVVARTAWVYADHGRNFLRTMLRLADERETGPGRGPADAPAAPAPAPLRVVDDQRGSPTFAADLAGALLDLAAARDVSGIFHVTNAGSTTWCGFARALLAAAGRGAVVTPTTTDAFPRPAPRPANSVLEDSRLEDAGVERLPEWGDALGRCVGRGL